MLSRIFRIKKRPESLDNEVAEEAGRLFDSGRNCSESVFQSVTGLDNPQILAMCKPFGGGIGGQKCLCGAVTGGDMALGLKGKGECAARLVETFRKKYGATCCSALSRPYRWKSKEHLANCRSITTVTASLTETLLKS